MLIGGVTNYKIHGRNQQKSFKGRVWVYTYFDVANWQTLRNVLYIVHKLCYIYCKIIMSSLDDYLYSYIILYYVLILNKLLFYTAQVSPADGSGILRTRGSSV